MELVSVIIPNYNTAKYIADAIESVLSQAYQNFELIVVDDGSTDNTKEVVQKYINQPTFKYIFQENKGLSAARNTGIKASQGEFIAFLDADDIWLPEKLEHQIKLMDSDKVGIVSCSGYTTNEKGEILDTFIKKNYSNRYLLLRDLSMKNVVSGGGSTALVRKTCFDVIGLFDENLKSSEDWDMWLRIAQRFDIIFVEKPLVKIRVRNNSMCSSSNATKMLRYELLVIDKLFSSKSSLNLFNFLLKRKIYGYRYFRASNSCKLIGNDKDAKRYILKSFYLYPFNSLSKSYLLLVFYCFLGNKRFTCLKEYYKSV